MTGAGFERLFGGPAREAESRITRREMDLAASVQKITEEIVLKTARHLRKTTGERNLVMAGGVALNCVANGKIQEAGIFDQVFIQPAAGDAGGSLGAALVAKAAPRAARLKMISEKMTTGRRPRASEIAPCHRAMKAKGSR